VWREQARFEAEIVIALMIYPPVSIAQLPQRLARFKQLRETTPVVYDDGTQRWHVFRYADALQVLTDTKHFVPIGYGGASLPLFTNSMTYPSRQALARALVRQAAAPRIAAELRPHITSTARALLDRTRPLGTLDIIGDLAAPLSVAIFAELLGIALEDRQRFTQWMDVLGAGQVTIHDALRPDADPQGAAAAALHELVAYLAQLSAQRRRQPLQDLISRLLAAEIDGNRLREPEVVACCCTLLIGGYATATHLLGNAVLRLTDHPEVIARLRHEPPPVYSTVEEVLRYLPPVWNVIRLTMSDVTLGAQRIPAQAEVWVSIASANRDAEHFRDPDRFDIERIPNRHLSFGHRSQAWIGSALARQAARSTLTLLAKLLPDFKRVPDGDLEVIESSTLFGVKRLPVAFTPSQPSSV
jgi:cytochrome P450